ncbi:MAG TPA: hypothetical protein DCQ30_01190 [Acidimicrobiaceae bacterium]|nr:hypothetical protein [Acidimicrobiaceae bacterium]
MYLFSRQARLAPGRTTEAMSWALTVTEKVNQISEVPVTLWSTVFSPGVGTLAWSAIVEDLSVLEATDAKLMADSSYLGLLDQGAAFNSGAPVDDTIVNLVVADIGEEGPPAYGSIVQTVLAGGAMAKGIELGAQIAQQVKSVTGCRCSFGVAGTGQFGAVGWITGYESIEQLEQAQQALQADADFGTLLDERASQVYLRGTTTQTIYRRLV